MKEQFQQLDDSTPNPLIRTIVVASSGNLVEWFDFYIYSFCSLYFSHLFFPDSDPTTQLLKSAAIFAVGFLVRPLGGWIFGRFGDRHGRKNAMLISVCMMCIGSLVIACLPGYAVIGVWAPTLLLLARIFQGISIGGEYGTTATYMSEVAHTGRRGFYASFQYVTIIGGQMLSLLVLVILQAIMTREALYEWGWRIPFVVGALLAVVALWLRRSLSETTDSTIRHHRDAGRISALWQHKKSVALVLVFTAGGTLSYYVFTVYMQKYLVNTVGMAPELASRIMIGALIIYMLLHPLVGALSDRIGRRRSMMIFGVLATLCTVPILTLLRSADSPWYAFFLVMLALTITSFYTSISGVLKAEMFPTEVRALGVGLSYAVANALFGGSAEYVALSLKVAGHEAWFYWYVTAMSVLVLVTAFMIPSKEHEALLQRPPGS